MQPILSIQSMNYKIIDQESSVCSSVVSVTTFYALLVRQSQSHSPISISVTNTTTTTTTIPLARPIPTVENHWDNNTLIASGHYLLELKKKKRKQETSLIDTRYRNKKEGPRRNI
ncbi:hypothetical protein PCANC_27702 [Puccinia coronata f. sp. avenae]|uniref:Uncharacterized protein n=1 Tax=Puccinia coronata f. sp. avenae TaxID=200324 RepID=A0A2N5RY48_9BASI|nr:hypothetical protein PCANC_27702 [Puccinia coronata f. sp. avenae]